jgi:DNA-directed RNA polymerase specialized sigma24 family protein
MTSTGSVTHWIGQLKAGDPAAAQKLWEGYFQKMVELARRKLQGLPRRAADEEDVALSAFNSFCQGIRGGRFPQLRDRDSLWPLLVAITAHKAVDLTRHERRLKRGGPAPDARRPAAPEAELEQVIGREPTPEFALQVAEECQRLLDRLGDEGLRSIALWKMEGNTVEEIATRLGCVPRTIERKLQVIRRLWGEETVG